MPYFFTVKLVVKRIKGTGHKRFRALSLTPQVLLKLFRNEK